MRLAAALLLLLLPACVFVRLPVGPSDGVQEVSLMGEGPEKVLLVDVSGLLSIQRPWAPPGLPRAESLPADTAESLPEAVARMEAAGLPHMEAIKAVARERGLPKRTVYAELEKASRS